MAGVLAKKEEWVIPEVVQGMEEGRIAFLGATAPWILNSSGKSNRTWS